MISEEPDRLFEKSSYFADIYASEIDRSHNSEVRRNARSVDGAAAALTDFVDRTIKWTSELERHLERKSDGKIGAQHIVRMYQRPFACRHVIFHPVFTHRQYRLTSLFDGTEPNETIAFLSVASKRISGFGYHSNFRLWPLENLERRDARYCSLPLPKCGERIDDVTDWALGEFKERYKKEVDEARFNERVGNGGISQTITLPDGTVETLIIEPAACVWPTDEKGVPAITKDAILRLLLRRPPTPCTVRNMR